MVVVVRLVVILLVDLVGKYSGRSGGDYRSNHSVKA